MKLENVLTALPEQEVTQDVLQEKYAKGDERTVHDIRKRVARALASIEAPEQRQHWETEFLWAMENGFIPAGRINSAAGTSIQATLINCFVQPIGDAVWGHGEDGTPGIYAALQEAAETMRRGGGVGYDFSSIRPKGALVRGTHSRASGPVSYMRVFDKSCETLESAGSRRGAQMGVLRVDHPDIEEFVNAKRDGSLSNFNMSVAVTDVFMQAVHDDAGFELVHEVPPFEGEGVLEPRADGKFVYRTIRARDLWDQVMRSTYEHAEPGVIFIDRVNRDNNLSYCERIEASNPCGEQFLPPYGCCDLGSLNLVRFVSDPFGESPRFDFERFARVVSISVRALDNVLDLTLWPLPSQDSEAKAKRRVGLGFTGLGNALTMMKLRYDSDAGREFAAKIARSMRDVAYETSVALAGERGAFPLFNAEAYLAEPHAASRLPESLKKRIRKEGIRNSHLMSIAPTGTISIAFGSNSSGGIEPAFSWTYTRRKRMPDGSRQEYEVEDYAYRLFRHMGGNVAALPDYFVSAMQIGALDHMRMSAVVQPYVDSAISKTVNVAEDYPYEEFKNLYYEAWNAGLKGITTYRPNAVIGSVLSVGTPAASATQPQDLSEDPDRRLLLEKLPRPALSSLRWPSRPRLASGNMAWSYMFEPLDRRTSFCIFIGQTEETVERLDGSTGVQSVPFETWVNGNEQPRGLGAIAKALSMDMRSNDRGWLRLKLDALARTRDEQPMQLPFPPDGEVRWSPGVVAAFAEIVRQRCEELGSFDALDTHSTPMLDALMFRKEPKSGPLGTLSWTADISNAATGDDFVLGVKELQLPDGTRRPYSIWLAGDYPKVLDGLCKLLSLDMHVVDVNWIGLKLRKLLSFGELNGSFWAPVPGESRQQVYPSTVAYIAELILHRYKVLGLLDGEGRAIGGAGALALPEADAPATPPTAAPIIAGQSCPSCSAHAYIRKDGCMFCTACGHQGECG
jgi:ribonucleoside-diphosphate reductase alpha chain